jgi:hypothetical protein
MPHHNEADAWLSRSTRSTRRRADASAAARFTAVVVLPTPPLLFTTAITTIDLSVILSTNRAGETPREAGRPPQTPRSGLTADVQCKRQPALTGRLNATETRQREVTEGNRGNGGSTTEIAELTEPFRFFSSRVFSVGSDGSVVPFSPLPHLPPLTQPTPDGS